MTDEVWAKIPGLPDYEVSSEGRARSWKKQGSMPLPKMLRVRVGHNGYLKFNCVRNGRAGTMDVHRAMGFAFLGDPPSPRHHVDHKDDVRTNCMLGNLEWKSPSENIKRRRIRRISAGLKEAARQCRLIGNKSYGAIAKEFGIDHRTARRYAATTLSQTQA